MCARHSESHDNLDVRAVRIVGDRTNQVRHICRGCREHLSKCALGYEFREVKR
jgi:hypothetical protein